MGAQSRPTRAAARPRYSVGPALNAALSRSTSKSQKKGNCIEWTLSCAGRDVCERQEVGLFSITGVFLPRLQSRAFNPALDRRTSKSDGCDSPQLLFLKQTTWKQRGTSRTRRGSLLSRQNKDVQLHQTLWDLRTNPGCAPIHFTEPCLLLCLWRLPHCSVKDGSYVWSWAPERSLWDGAVLFGRDLERRPIWTLLPGSITALPINADLHKASVWTSQPNTITNITNQHHWDVLEAHLRKTHYFVKATYNNIECNTVFPYSLRP